MSWIKDNQFAVALGGGTLVGAIALFFVGSKAGTRYETALSDYQAAADQVSQFEKLPLYPNSTNRDGKKKALGDYIQAVDGLQGAFKKFRPEPFTNLPPQQITDTLIKSAEEVGAAFEEKETIVPETFFLGFEGYKDSLAREGATGVLNYQIGAARELFLALAGAGPSALSNVHRPALPEESGNAFESAPGAVTRTLPIEITFVGTEQSARDFLTAISKSENYYYVIRTLRIGSEKKSPPLHTDAKFETPKAAGAGTPAANDPFGGGFVIPGEEEEEKPAEEEKPTGGAPAPAADEKKEETPAPAAEVQPVPTDSGRILAQVLGTEQVQVFLRIEITQFLPAKELPKP
jgi:hypothetical protein